MKEMQPSDNCARLCPKMKCDDNGRPVGAAFMLREGEEYLSVNWLEHDGDADRESQLEMVRKHLLEGAMRNIPPLGKFAVLNVGQTISRVESESPDARTLEFVYIPLPGNPSHAGIRGYSWIAAEQLIADLIAESIVEVWPTVS